MVKVNAVRSEVVRGCFGLCCQQDTQNVMSLVSKFLARTLLLYGVFSLEDNIRIFSKYRNASFRALAIS
jgi:hypothetical protein